MWRVDVGGARRRVQKCGGGSRHRVLSKRVTPMTPGAAEGVRRLVGCVCSKLPPVYSHQMKQGRRHRRRRRACRAVRTVRVTAAEKNKKCEWKLLKLLSNKLSHLLSLERRRR